ncbi:2-succinyl-6-hydroxy-2,4-cyclohexadiene-1-carboxylate synthase [Sporosarcina sp. P12(2017)]|uniref:2-succinyl-6-hydroxy-2, 4-cyclohexadiene-1-carboxylate synthase n=1 Tax=unclassified Sporosarcina TaxID=2647733 RepID=UPI000C16BF14|nr:MULTISPECIES: 2-succinyl-6-hydroxy-2,4-cyclohexadiene-1-carboxylate synthase [unclassified Sporosarcina]PIC56060.1 2-succinyl-6-hydroxy-2,4-cyclohexadiene-1-carboxylate synthase [Sporosarcina sp. P10]PIC59411.1 2-succinyl-6-hydroxy-2,4-cyclohexadiene-1-carboxylate synthase [Sporosarcina sp. P12(2017)]
MATEVLTIRGINTHVARYGNEQLPAVVMLHGFTGSTATWQKTIEVLMTDYYVLAVDLIGHGKTEAPETMNRYKMEEQIKDLYEVLQKLEIKKPILIGYSMGGRVALGYTATYPEEVTSLVLESSSPGLRTSEQQLARRTADAKLADRIERQGMIEFVDFWQEIPLFHSQKKLSESQQQAVRAERLNQRPTGLANSLRGIGTGSQPSYWQALEQLSLPVLLLTGSEDEKFENIAQEMMKSLPNARHETIKDAGHAIHVEKPQQFATMIKSYLKTV